MPKHSFPAILSAIVCPGLGQMVKGQRAKGFAILAGLVFGIFVNTIFYVLLPLWSGIIFSAGLVAFYLWNVWDAWVGW